MTDKNISLWKVEEFLIDNLKELPIGNGKSKLKAICICCKGKTSHCNNFIWIYKGEEHTIQDRIKKVKSSLTRSKKLEMYDRDGKLIRTYDSILQASKTSGDSYMIINRQLKTGIITKNAIHIWKQV